MCDIHDSLITFIDSISCESTPAMALPLGTSHEHDATAKGNIVQLTTCIYKFQHLMCKRFASTICLVIFVRDLFSRFSRVKSQSRKVNHKILVVHVQSEQCFNPSYQKLPYTWVNKRIRFFQKLQGNMRLVPNMHLIYNEGKN